MDDRDPDDQPPARPGRLGRITAWLQARPLMIIIVLIAAYGVERIVQNLYWDSFVGFLAEHGISVTPPKDG
ncbi:hypothetical protein [uncultured Sphingomonas sp.]|uniref:hypothetical protein n=1 Tax=uncultured Sphingomonas sp. TaxID=158754 RepID=UPI0035C9FA70